MPAWILRVRGFSCRAPIGVGAAHSCAAVVWGCPVIGGGRALCGCMGGRYFPFMMIDSGGGEGGELAEGVGGSICFRLGITEAGSYEHT